jgi:hypothetical protein
MDMNQRKMWLGEVKQALKNEGFSDTIFQIVKPNQVFGLVMKIDEIWEMHVRGFEDGHLEPEIEVSREYIEHLDPKYRYTEPAIDVLTEILDRYSIPYETSEHKRLEWRIEPPGTLTEWQPLLTLFALIGGLLGLAYLLRRR